MLANIALIDDESKWEGEVFFLFKLSSYIREYKNNAALENNHRFGYEYKCCCLHLILAPPHIWVFPTFFFPKMTLFLWFIDRCRKNPKKYTKQSIVFRFGVLWINEPKISMGKIMCRMVLSFLSSVCPLSK